MKVEDLIEKLEKFNEEYEEYEKKKEESNIYYYEWKNLEVDLFEAKKRIIKQEKMIDLMVKHICDIIDNDDNASLLPFYDSDDNIEEKVKQYFEKKAEESDNK